MHPCILLINPWIHDFAAVNMWARPLGLLQVAEFLSAYAVTLKWIDCLDRYTLRRFHQGKFPRMPIPKPACLQSVTRTFARYGISEEDFSRQCKTALPVDAILITSIMTYWYPGVFETIRWCRQLSPGTPIGLGGIYPQCFPTHALSKSGADFIFTGAVDQTLIGMLADRGVRLVRKQPAQPYYRLGLYPLLQYAPLLTSSGCPFRCTYCAAGVRQPQWRQRPLREIVREINDLCGLGVEDLAFYDDALLYRSEAHLRPLLQAILSAGIRVNFHTPNGLHARFLNRPLARLMKKAGFKTIRLGLETIDGQRQTRTGGKVSNQELTAAVMHLQEAGFTKNEIGVYLMYGLPEQPVSEVWEGVRFLEKINVRIHLTEFSPLPQTPAWQELIARQCIPADLDPLLTNNTVFSAMFSGYTAEEIKKLKDYVAQCNQKVC